MLNKDIDYALIGNNFMTFLLAVRFLNRGKKVLILDDDRLNYGEFFTNSLTSLDIEFLKNWGEIDNIGPFKNIDQYLTKQSTYLYVGKKHIALGDTPVRNYRELCRKFPNLFMHEKKGPILIEDEMMAFNRSYNDFCKKVAQTLFQEKKVSHLGKVFEDAMPADLSFHVQHFFSHFSKKREMAEREREEFNALIFMSRGFFQKKLSVTGSYLEMMHLFCSLISPSFKLDHQRLIFDLQLVHKLRGGEFKKLNFADLKFQNGRIKSFELESFEGIIRPLKMALIGEQPVDYHARVQQSFSTRFKKSSSIYHCLNIMVKFSHPLPTLLREKKILFTSSMKIGTDRPMWEVHFFDKMAIFNLLIAKREGMKIDFIKESVLTLLKNDLDFVYPEYYFDIVGSEMKLTLDLLEEDKNYCAHEVIGPRWRTRLQKIIETGPSRFFPRLKNVFYIGPYHNEDALGLFSALLEIKYWQERL